MHPTLVFDIETIPDLSGFAAVNGIDTAALPQAELAEMALLARRQKTGSDFMPHHLHRVVAISCTLRSGDQLKVWSLGARVSYEVNQGPKGLLAIKIRTEPADDGVAQAMPSAQPASDQPLMPN